MKNTVYTVIAVLLLATLCLPAAAQTWVLEDWYAGPDDDFHSGMFEIEFRNNNQVFYSRWNRLYKWDFEANRAWWLTFASSETIDHIEVPRRDSDVVIHSVGGGGWLQIRDANDMGNLLATRDLGGGEILSLDVDEGGYYAVVQSSAIGPKFYAEVYDIWGSNGWQFARHTGNDFGARDGDLIMHPSYAIDYGSPRWYRQINPGEERFHEYTNSWGNQTDSYITTGWNHIDKIAMTVRYGTDNGKRLAALDSGNIIHVWDYAGNHLFTFNHSEGFGAADHILEFTPNGELLVTANQKNVRFWDMSTRELDHSFTVAASSSNIAALAFSDNGKLMAIGDAKGTAYIYRWTGQNRPAAPAQKVEPAQPTALLSNYPNPFNPETWIPYQLSEAAEVTVTIHSSDGKLVRTLELGQMPAGVYSDKGRAAYWNGQNEQGEPVASGVYFYTLKAGEFSATRKMVIRK